MASYKRIITDYSVKHPWRIMLLALVAVIGFGYQFPKVHFDNDPENMLSPDEPVRLYHSKVKKQFSLYDFVVVGIVNEADTNGVFNKETLGRIHNLTLELISLHKADDGTPAVRRNGQEFKPELLPKNKRDQVLNVIFRHDPNHLFDEAGKSAIINQEIISPSVVDNLKQSELGSLKQEYLMETAPETQDEALAIRDDAMNNPLYKGTLVSENGKALALYIPIKEKHYAHNVSQLVKALTADWPESDQIYITGLPVAEDTFGVEMLKQMTTSAPFAGVIIFILLFVFFRKLQLIIAPMLVAIISIVCTMGLLIGLGFDVHIMSSMIAIFLMPIAVTDSVHMLSEFYDTYQKFQDKGKTIKHVVGHLFMPMLYTSLTTIAGFASLGLTPIPPVRVFGLHVAFGVAMAWLLTVTFVPAYIMLFMSEKSLKSFGTAHSEGSHDSALLRGLGKLGGFSYNRWKLILMITGAVIVVSAIGISKININDNPVKWFTPEHNIRVADRILNKHFGGTYTAYLTLHSEARAKTCREKLDHFRKAVNERFSASHPEQEAILQKTFDNMEQLFGNVVSCDPEKCFAELMVVARKLDDETNKSWNLIADEVNYLPPKGLDYDALKQAVNAIPSVSTAGKAAFFTAAAGLQDKKDADLQNAALAICDTATKVSFAEFLRQTQVDLTAPAMKRPEVLAYIDALQEHLKRSPVVGKSSSCVDALKKANYEINFVKDMPERNRSFYSIPKTASAAAQVYIQLEGMKKKDSLFHLVNSDYDSANIWVQLKSGDNQKMKAVVDDIDDYFKTNPLPADIESNWAGLTYLNIVWQEKMVTGMLGSLASSFVVVLIMMMILFRSPTYGLLSMIPLSVTIAFIYGIIGWIGKDYDMPVAVLSSLTLGLSIDFAIHFLERSREMVKQHGSWQAAIGPMFGEPAAAISRNAIVIAIGFLPLLLAPLVPYKTVGFFLGTIMAVSGMGTLFILPALVTMLQNWLFKTNEGDSE